jgi:serine/threonine-protein kinase
MGRPVTGASDLYALGVVGFEMLTGTRPFDEESAVATALAHINNPPPPLPAHVTDPVRSAIEACLAKDPDHRPSSASSLAALLGMPVSGVGSASPAARVIPVTDLGMTQPFRVPAVAPTEVVPQAAATSVLGAGAAAAAAGAAGAAGAGGAIGGVGAGAAGAGAPAYLPPATPPIGPTDEDPDEEEDDRGASGWWWLLPIAVALLVGTFFYLQSRNPAPAPPKPAPTVTVAPTTTSSAPTTSSTPPTTTSAAPTTTTTGPKTVVVIESDYVGQQIGTVRQTLTALGLTKPIKVVEVANAAPKGTVLGVSPTGTVAADVTVTVTVSKGPAVTPTTSAPAATTSATGPTTAGG